MPTNTPSRRRSTVFWLTPAVGLVIALAYLVAGIAGGRPALGVGMAAVMLAVVAVILVAARYSETVRGLLDRRDERLTTIDRQATAVAGVAIIVAVLGAFVVEVARGEDGQPYSWLGAVGGLAYLAAVIVQRVRR